MNGMHTTDEQGDYSRSLAVPKTNSLTVIDVHSTMLFSTSILVLFSQVNIFIYITINFPVSNYFHHHNQYGAIIYLCTCSYV